MLEGGCHFAARDGGVTMEGVAMPVAGECLSWEWLWWLELLVCRAFGGEGWRGGHKWRGYAGGRGDVLARRGYGAQGYDARGYSGKQGYGGQSYEGRGQGHVGRGGC